MMVIYLALIFSLFSAISAFAQSTCSGGGADVKYITQNSDWSSINTTSFNVFCVSPGDYRTQGTITITQDGTSGNRKYLLYYDPSNPNDDTHPVHMQFADRATVHRINMNNADYWTISRISVDPEFSTSLGYGFLIDGSNNIVEKSLIEKSGTHNLYFLNPNTNFNIIRENVIRDIWIPPAGGPQNVDRICVFMNANGNPAEQRGNIIENNEIYNCTQAIQLIGGTGFSNRTYPDTIIRNNDMYIDSSRHTDCAGNLDPDGDCFAGESMFIVKEGGEGATDILWIYGNRIWGLRKGDSEFSAPGGNGEGILVYGESDYTLLENNIIHETTRGLQMEGSGTNNKSAVDNIVYDAQLWVSNTGQSLLSINGTTQEWYRNIFVGADSSWRTASTNLDFRCNTLINIPARYTGESVGSGTIADYNFYYNTPEWTTASPDNDVVDSTAAASNNASLTFTRKRITAPELFTIPLALTTASSPHFGACDPNLGSRVGIGVDDRDWSTGPSFVFSIQDGGNKSVQQGSSVSQTITATTTSGTSHPIFFWHRNSLPSGVSIAYDPSYCDPGGTSCQTTVTISTMGSTATGDHTITLAGESGQWVKEDSFTLTVQSSGGDTENPVAAITSPTSASTHSTASTPLTTLSGTATDNVGVSSVVWENASTSAGGAASGCAGETSCNWSVSSISLNEGGNVITVTATDASANEGTDTITVSLDTTAPVRADPSPSEPLASGTTQTSISLTTNETATCKYDIDSGDSYATMATTFTNTNNTSHSTTVSGLSDGSSYTYYVKCKDVLDNANTDNLTISFAVGNEFVAFPTAPVWASTTASSTATFPSAPTGVGTSASGSPTMPPSVTSVSTATGANPTFPSVPTGVSTP